MLELLDLGLRDAPVLVALARLGRARRRLRRRLLGRCGQFDTAQLGQALAGNVDIEHILRGRDGVKARRHALRKDERHGRAIRRATRLRRNQLGRQIGQQGTEIDAHGPLERGRPHRPLLGEGRFGGHRPVELHAQECGIAADAHIDPGVQFRRHAGLAVALGLDSRQAGALGQFVDDLLGQRWRHALPGRWQKVDEQLLAGLDTVEIEAALEPQPQSAPVRVLPRHREIIRHGRGNVRQNDIHRVLELDRKHVVVDLELIGRQFVQRRKAQDQAAKTVFFRRKELALVDGKCRRDNSQHADHCCGSQGQECPLPA